MALGQTTYNELGLATWGLNDLPYADLTDTGNTTGHSLNDNWDRVDTRFKRLRDAADFVLQSSKPASYLATYGMWAYDDTGAGEKVLKLEGFERIDLVAINDVVATEEWVEQYFQGIEWQDSVKDRDLATPPVSPSTGDRYIVASGGTGAWNGHDDDITEWDGAAWDFTTPTLGMITSIDDEGIIVRWNGSIWADICGLIDHNNTSGKQGGQANEYYHFNFSEHGYLAGIDQSLATTDDVAFNQMFLADDKELLFGNTVGTPDVDMHWNSASSWFEMFGKLTGEGLWFVTDSTWKAYMGLAYSAIDKSIEMSITHTVSGWNHFYMYPTETIFNGSGDDVDFQIQGDSIVNLFKIDGGLDKVGIGVKPLTANWSLFTVEDSIMSKEVATPANQISGYGKWYFKADHKPYAQGDDGTEYDLTSSSGGTCCLWIPAGAIKPTITSGCSNLISRELTAGRPEITSINFDGTSIEYAQFTVRFPDNWNNGTITFKIHWTSTAIDTDSIVFGVQAVACADGDTINVVYGTAVEITDAAQSANGDQYISAESAALTIAGSPASGEEVKFQVYRDPTDVSDTMAEDMELLGIEIFYDLT
jgi:hypothetical protein